MTTEAGGYALEGEAFASGGTRAVVVNGIEINYTLTLADGAWSASCACEVEVALGASGSTVTLSLNDADGTFSLGGNPVASGFRHMGYELALEGGQWAASFVPVTQAITLGALGGTLELTQLENGSWIAPDGAEVPTGSRVVVGGNRYLLTLGLDGTWTAAYSPETMELLGTGLTVSATEGGGYEISGVGLEFDADGRDSITLDTGEQYLVTRNEDGTLQGARQEIALEEGTAGSLGNLSDVKRELANDRTSLLFDLAGDADPLFSFTDLFADGTDEAQGEGFVARAIADIEEIRADAALLIQALDGDGEAGDLDQLLGREGLWGRIDTALDGVFGPDDPESDTDDDLGGAPAADDFLEEVDEILAALSSPEALAAADDGGVFEREFDGEFDARNWEATVWLGSMGSARFGVAQYALRTDASAEATTRSGSFHYSTTKGTGALRRVMDRLDLSGEVFYDGETRAIDGTGNVYSGEIALQVQLGASQVSGTIDNLRTAGGDLWEPSWTIAGRGIQRINLPKVFFDRDVGWAGRGNGWVSVSSRTGLNRQIPAEFRFRGLLLGRGDDVGEEAVGDWESIVGDGQRGTADWIVGAFGAILNDVDDVRLPSVAARGGQVDAILTNWQEGITATDGELDLGELERRVADADPAEWRLDLAAAYDTQGRLRTDDGEQWVALARSRLESLRGRLMTFHQLDRDSRGSGSMVLAAETAQWNDALDAASEFLFGIDDRATPGDVSDDGPYTGDAISARFPDTSDSPPAGRGYPSASGATAATDDEALDLVDELLEALASNDGFQNAYKDGGIFEFVDDENVAGRGDRDGDTSDGVLGNPRISAGEGSAGDDFARVQSQVRSLAASTTLTRFGLFWGRETTSAVNAGMRADADGSGSDLEEYSQTGLYAYSPLGPARYASAIDPHLPRGGGATYVGEALASYNEVLYTGTSEVFVTWQRPQQIPADTLVQVIGNLRATFALERLDNGDRLVALVGEDVVDIDEVVFSDVALEWSASGIRVLGRDLQAPVFGTRVDFWNRTDGARATVPLGSDDGTDPNDEGDLGQHLDALFVGHTVAAPAGVIGYFKVQNPAGDAPGFRFNNRQEDARTEDTADGLAEALVGTFGADLDPSSIRPAGDESGSQSPDGPGPDAEVVVGTFLSNLATFRLLEDGLRFNRDDDPARGSMTLERQAVENPGLKSFGLDIDGDGDLDHVPVMAETADPELAWFGGFRAQESIESDSATVRVSGSLDDFSQTALFAYSPETAMDTLPAAGTARYTGEAVAAFNGVWYSGTAELAATWSGPLVITSIRTDSVGALSATFRFRRLSNGARLVAVTAGGQGEIDTIEFAHVGLEWDADESAIVSDGSAAAVTITSATSDATLRWEAIGAGVSSDLNAKFLRGAASVVPESGHSNSGVPTGVMGYFRVSNPIGSDAALRLENAALEDRTDADAGQALAGAFGAGLVPEIVLPTVGDVTAYPARLREPALRFVFESNSVSMQHPGTVPSWENPRNLGWFSINRDDPTGTGVPVLGPPNFTILESSFARQGLRSFAIFDSVRTSDRDDDIPVLVTMLSKETSLTRFGAFWVHEPASSGEWPPTQIVALEDGITTQQTIHENTAVFAYAFAPRSWQEPLANIEASFLGEAVAAYDGVWYTGTVALHAQLGRNRSACEDGPRCSEAWHEDAEALALSAVISLVRQDDGRTRLVAQLDSGEVTPVDAFEFDRVSIGRDLVNRSTAWQFSTAANPGTFVNAHNFASAGTLEDPIRVPSDGSTRIGTIENGVRTFGTPHGIRERAALIFEGEFFGRDLRVSNEYVPAGAIAEFRVPNDPRSGFFFGNAAGGGSLGVEGSMEDNEGKAVIGVLGVDFHSVEIPQSQP